MIKCCYKCTKRVVNCHATCKAYAEEVAQEEERKASLRKAKAVDKEYTEYKKNRKRARGWE